MLPTGAKRVQRASTVSQSWFSGSATWAKVGRRRGEKQDLSRVVDPVRAWAGAGPRNSVRSGSAEAALAQILAIMTDQVLAGDGPPRWTAEHLMQLETRLGVAGGNDDLRLPDVEDSLDIADAALLLYGMAFTEVASADLPWIDVVRWTANFVAGELRNHWSEDEWWSFTADGI